MAKPITFTAPQAVVMVGTQKVGFLKNIRFSENIQRQPIKGISETLIQEAPVTEIRCSLQADFFFISFQDAAMKAILDRNKTVANFINNLTLGESGLSISVYRKTLNSDGTVNEQGSSVVNIKDFLIESQNLDISDNQVSGTNVSGMYLTPILAQVN